MLDANSTLLSILRLCLDIIPTEFFSNWIIFLRFWCEGEVRERMSVKALSLKTEKKKKTLRLTFGIDFFLIGLKIAAFIRPLTRIDMQNYL